MDALGALVVVVLSPLPQLRRYVMRCIAPQGHVVVGAATIEEARARAEDLHRADSLDVLAIDGQMLARVGWRARELAETLAPGRRLPLVGLVRRDAHRPPPDYDLTRAGIVALYEPFQAAELAMVVNWLGRHQRAA